MQNSDCSLAKRTAESGFRNAASDTVRVRYRQVNEAACRSVSMTKNLDVVFVAKSSTNIVEPVEAGFTAA